MKELLYYYYIYLFHLKFNHIFMHSSAISGVLYCWRLTRKHDMEFMVIIAVLPAQTKSGEHKEEKKNVHTYANNNNNNTVCCISTLMMRVHFIDRS